jgi:hypothetical protein
MPYDYVVDQERQMLWVRYSGTVAADERRAAAEHILSQPGNRELRRVLLDYRRATSLIMDDAASTALADYLAAHFGDRGARVAWLVTYDHQLDPVVEGKSQARGITSERFRDLDDAVAWLLRSEPAANPEADAGAAPEPQPESESAGTPFGFHMAIGSSHPARAKGSFEVKIAPQAPDSAPAQAAALARLSLDKRYSGPLDAIGQGEMLAEGGGGRKDGAYVAMERVTGTLHGRAGSFALVHRALMRDGAPQDWTVVVVPGSGTGALAGLEGSLRITVEQGMHFYDLEYTLAPEIRQ